MRVRSNRAGQLYTWHTAANTLTNSHRKDFVIFGENRFAKLHFVALMTADQRAQNTVECGGKIFNII